MLDGVFSATMVLNTTAWLVVFVAIVMGLFPLSFNGDRSILAGLGLFGLFFGASLLITLHLMKKDPTLLARRLSTGPTAEQKPQKIMMLFASIGFIALLVVPALRYRFIWSSVPPPMVIAVESRAQFRPLADPQGTARDVRAMGGGTRITLPHGDAIWGWGRAPISGSDKQELAARGFRYAVDRAASALPGSFRLVDLTSNAEVAEFLGEGRNQDEVLARRKTALPTFTDLNVVNDPVKWDKVDVVMVYAYPYHSTQTLPMTQLEAAYQKWQGKAQFAVVQAFGDAPDAQGYALPTPDQLNGQIALARKYGFDVAVFRWEAGGSQDLIRSVFRR